MFSWSESDSSYYIQAESGMSVYRLPDTEGMLAAVTSSQAMSGGNFRTVGAKAVQWPRDPPCHDTWRKRNMTYPLHLSSLLSRWVLFLPPGPQPCALRCRPPASSPAERPTQRRLLASSMCQQTCALTQYVGRTDMDTTNAEAECRHGLVSSYLYLTPNRFLLQSIGKWTVLSPNYCSQRGGHCLWAAFNRRVSSSVVLYSPYNRTGEAECWRSPCSAGLLNG